MWPAIMKYTHPAILRSQRCNLFVDTMLIGLVTTPCSALKANFFGIKTILVVGPAPVSIETGKVIGCTRFGIGKQTFSLSRSRNCSGVVRNVNKAKASFRSRWLERNICASPKRHLCLAQCRLWTTKNKTRTDLAFFFFLFFSFVCPDQHLLRTLVR